MPIHAQASPSWEQVEDWIKEAWSDPDVVLEQEGGLVFTYCKHIPARSLLGNIGRGACSLNLFPNTDPTVYFSACGRFVMEDEDALRHDWLAVGCDILQGIAKVKPAIEACVDSASESPQPTYR